MEEGKTQMGTASAGGPVCEQQETETDEEQMAADEEARQKK